jgi:ABC-type multidrug transport system fused ATPase/permease subunit
MKIIIVAIVTALAAAAVSVAGLLLVKRIIKLKGGEHHAVAEALLAVVGTLFSVLLGFLVVGTMNGYEDARSKVNLEAQYLADVFRFAKGLPPGPRHDLRNTCRAYCRAVSEEEWPRMELKQDCPHAWQLYYRLWDESLSVSPVDQRESNIHQALLTSMQGLGESRRSRIAILRRNLPPVLWLVAISGCTIIIIFIYFFVVESIVLHSVMTGLVAISLYLIVFLLTLYDNPFSGELKLSPIPFEVNDKLFEIPDDPVSYLEKWKSMRSK